MAEETTQSAIPSAALFKMLYDAGATTKTSNGVTSLKCSASEVNRSITGFCEHHSSASLAT